MTILIIAGCLSRNPQTTSLQHDCEGTLSMVDAVFTAGQNIFVEIYQENCYQDHSIIIENIYGINTFNLPEKKAVRMKIPNNISQYAGNYVIKLSAKKKVIAQLDFKVIAEKRVAEIEAYYGPKTIPIDRKQKFMFVSIPRDIYGNPSPKNTAINYDLYYTQKNKKSSNTTESLLTFNSIDDYEMTGKIRAGSYKGNVHSVEAEVLINSGWPQSIALSTDMLIPYADARQFFTIQTAKILDQKGNVVNDGSMVNFNIKRDSSLIARYRGYTINGIAKVLIQNPDQPGKITIHTDINHIEKSNPIELNFASAINEYAFHFNEQQKQLEVGPIVSYLGAIIHDGFKAEIQYEDIKYDQEIKEGYISIPFNDKIPDSISINIGGIKTKWYHNES